MPRRRASLALAATLVAAFFTLAGTASAGNFLASGHDYDLHCTFGSAQCHYLKTAIQFVRAGAPDPTKPVLVLDKGSLEMFNSINGQFGPGSAVLMDPASPAFASAPITTSLYSAVAIASDSTCGGCDLNESAGTVDSDAINKRAADLKTFFNAGGGLAYAAGAGRGDGSGTDEVYYKSVPIGIGGAPVFGPFKLTDVGRKLGFHDSANNDPAGTTDNDINCCATHNSFNEPPAGGALQVAERDSTGLPETLVAVGKIGDGGFVSGASINDVSHNEGNSGTTPFTFTVTLDSASTKTVTIDFTTQDGTAKAGSDYTAKSGTLTFAPGEKTKTITVDVHGDTTTEPNETFSVKLSNAKNATIGDDTGQGTIVNDDVSAIADLSIGKSGPASARNGVNYSYSLSVSNGGPGAATGVVVTDKLPAGVNFVSASPGCTNSSGTVTCTVGVLAKGASKTLTITVQPQTQGSKTNTASVKGDQSDPNTANNSSSATTQVGPGLPASLALAPKTATNPVDATHCVTATVKDRFGAVIPNEPVDFKVAGAVNTTGSRTTNSGGQAQFCYTGPAFPGSDTITATARNGSKPSDTAGKTWAFPSAGDCAIKAEGKIDAANGGNARVKIDIKDEDRKPKDALDYDDHVRGGLDVSGKKGNYDVFCSADFTQATIFAKVPRDPDGRLVWVRIDVIDGGKKGPDKYRIRSQDGYDSGQQLLTHGKITVRPSHHSHGSHHGSH